MLPGEPAQRRSPHPRERHRRRADRPSNTRPPAARLTRRLPAVNGHDVVRALERGGFYVHHIKGSHCALRHPEKPGLRVILPLHRNDLPAGTVRAIIRQAGLTMDEFTGLL